ncbi:IPT/TIG domain-containing protein, partial [candidate division KSB1 bacterium]|nr:IPT/TIG domain-containing protein [candidate division KSB1 bacterium]
MKSKNKLTWIGILLLAIVSVSCNQELPDKLFDPDAPKGTTPVLTSIVPDGKPLAGVGRLTVTGENFSSVIEENYLYFNGVEATILSASPTQLYVIAPDVVGDSVVVKAAVFRVELFSNEIIYELIPAVSEYGRILEPGTETNQGYALAVDVNENVFVQTDPKKIKKISPNGITTDFATTTYVAATSMKFGPGGILYASAPAGRVRKIVQYDQAGNEILFTSFPAVAIDFDFDTAGDILAAVGADIYRVKPDQSKAIIGSFPGELKTIRLFNGQLYALELAD